MHSDFVLPGSAKCERLFEERETGKEEKVEVQEIKYLIGAQKTILQLCNKKITKLNEEKKELEKDLEQVVNELSEKENLMKMQTKEVQIESTEDKKLVQKLENLTKKHEKLANEKLLVANRRIKTEHDLDSTEKANELASKSLEKLIKWERWLDSLKKS